MAPQHPLVGMTARLKDRTQAVTIPGDELIRFGPSEDLKVSQVVGGMLCLWLRQQNKYVWIGLIMFHRKLETGVKVGNLKIVREPQPFPGIRGDPLEGVNYSSHILRTVFCQLRLMCARKGSLSFVPSWAWEAIGTT